VVTFTPRPLLLSQAKIDQIQIFARAEPWRGESIWRAELHARPAPDPGRSVAHPQRPPNEQDHETVISRKS